MEWKVEGFQNNTKPIKTVEVPISSKKLTPIATEMFEMLGKKNLSAFEMVFLLDNMRMASFRALSVVMKMDTRDVVEFKSKMDSETTKVLKDFVPSDMEKAVLKSKKQK